MSSKVIHIYRVEMGHVNDIQKTHWVYARNAKLAKEYCKSYFKALHYDYFKAIMVGEVIVPMDIDVMSLSDEDVEKIEKTIAKDGDRYAEHRYGVSRV